MGGGGKIMKGDVYEAFKKCKRNKTDKYKLAIPSLEKKFAEKYADGISRMLAWKMPKKLTSSAVDNVLESKELEVKSTLIPTKAELEEVYWQELTLCVEQEDTAS
ncbi:uncharacterized protein Fot_14739 [Forsythia ovata]|uniref:Uncharacterized protein n=1 Tax=Forsythia ovata TaxID=205694 RepID=A0ABD1W758_9LAMI